MRANVAAELLATASRSRSRRSRALAKRPLKHARPQTAPAPRSAPRRRGVEAVPETNQRLRNVARDTATSIRLRHRTLEKIMADHESCLPVSPRDPDTDFKPPPPRNSTINRRVIARRGNVGNRMRTRSIAQLVGKQQRTNLTLRAFKAQLAIDGHGESASSPIGSVVSSVASHAPSTATPRGRERRPSGSLKPLAQPKKKRHGGRAECTASELVELSRETLRLEMKHLDVLDKGKTISRIHVDRASGIDERHKEIDETMEWYTNAARDAGYDANEQMLQTRRITDERMALSKEEGELVITIAAMKRAQIDLNERHDLSCTARDFLFSLTPQSFWDGHAAALRADELASEADAAAEPGAKPLVDGEAVLNDRRRVIQALRSGVDIRLVSDGSVQEAVKQKALPTEKEIAMSANAKLSKELRAGLGLKNEKRSEILRKVRRRSASSIEDEAVALSQRVFRRQRRNSMMLINKFYAEGGVKDDPDAAGGEVEIADIELRKIIRTALAVAKDAAASASMAADESMRLAARISISTEASVPTEFDAERLKVQSTLNAEIAAICNSVDAPLATKGIFALDFLKRFEMLVASTLHNAWRRPRWRGPTDPETGEAWLPFEPREKTVGPTWDNDERIVDIANLPFSELPSVFQLENVLAARSACRCVVKELSGHVIGERIRRRQIKFERDAADLRIAQESTSPAARRRGSVTLAPRPAGATDLLSVAREWAEDEHFAEEINVAVQKLVNEGKGTGVDLESVAGGGGENKPSKEWKKSQDEQKRASGGAALPMVATQALARGAGGAIDMQKGRSFLDRAAYIQHIDWCERNHSSRAGRAHLFVPYDELEPDEQAKDREIVVVALRRLAPLAKQEMDLIRTRLVAVVEAVREKTEHACVAAMHAVAAADVAAAVANFALQTCINNMYASKRSRRFSQVPRRRVAHSMAAGSGGGEGGGERVQFKRHGGRRGPGSRRSSGRRSRNSGRSRRSSRDSQGSDTSDGELPRGSRNSNSRRTSRRSVDSWRTSASSIGSSGGGGGSRRSSRNSRRRGKKGRSSGGGSRRTSGESGDRDRSLSPQSGSRHGSASSRGSAASFSSEQSGVSGMSGSQRHYRSRTGSADSFSSRGSLSPRSSANSPRGSMASRNSASSIGDGRDARDGKVRMSTMARAARKIVRRGEEAKPMGVPNRMMKRVMRHGRRVRKRMQRDKSPERKFDSRTTRRRRIGAPASNRSLHKVLKIARRKRRDREAKGSEVETAVAVDVVEAQLDRSALPMYFTARSQMLRMFSELQDSNLAIMQRISLTEAAISDRETLFANDRLRLNRDYEEKLVDYEHLRSEHARIADALTSTREAQAEVIAHATEARAKGDARTLAEMGYEESEQILSTIQAYSNGMLQTIGLIDQERQEAEAAQRQTLESRHPSSTRHGEEAHHTNTLLAITKGGVVPIGEHRAATPFAAVWWDSVTVGETVVHPHRGAGVVVAINVEDDKRVHVKYENGVPHRYREQAFFAVRNNDLMGDADKGLREDAAELLVAQRARRLSGLRNETVDAIAPGRATSTSASASGRGRRHRASVVGGGHSMRRPARLRLNSASGGGLGSLPEEHRASAKKGMDSFAISHRRGNSSSPRDRSTPPRVRRPSSSGSQSRSGAMRSESRSRRGSMAVGRGGVGNRRSSLDRSAKGRQSILNGTSNGALLEQIQAELLKKLANELSTTPAQKVAAAVRKINRAARAAKAAAAAAAEKAAQEAAASGQTSPPAKFAALSISTGASESVSPTAMAARTARQEKLDCLSALTEVETCVHASFCSCLATSSLLTRPPSPPFPSVRRRHLEDLLVDVSPMDAHNVSAFLHRREIHRRAAQEKTRKASELKKLKKRRAASDAKLREMKEAKEKAALRARNSAKSRGSSRIKTTRSPGHATRPHTAAAIPASARRAPRAAPGVRKHVTSVSPAAGARPHTVATGVARTKSQRAAISPTHHARYLE